MPHQKVLITLSDLDGGNVSMDTQFLPEVKGISMSRAVSLWNAFSETAKAESRAPDWMSTYSGRRFFPTDPNPGEIVIQDIAAALSKICRFGGHCLEFYSVAQHSVHVSKLVPPELAYLGLMHDAAEAYIGDVIRPLKMSLAKYKSLETRVWEAIASRFNLPPENPTDNPIIKHADIVACMTEKRDLMAPSGHAWEKEYESVEIDPAIRVPLSPKAAEQLFMDRFNELTQ